MLKTIECDKGIYCLILKCSEPALIYMPKFKSVQFNKGYYCYIGSAQKNLSARLERHFRKNKTIHWHIDYLTANKNFSAEEAVIFKGKAKPFECELSQDFAKNRKFRTAVPGFGNSDCKECLTHLYYSAGKPSYSHFISLYQSIERLIPSSRKTF